MARGLGEAMAPIDGQVDPWEQDGLGFKDFGDAFTNVVKSLTSSKVISIEAGFGQGKTFFRHAWSQQLRQSGELVIEIDAQQSDHSGDPIITFLGALISAKPVSGNPLSASIKTKGLKLAGVAARSLTRAVLRHGAEELIDSAAEWAKEQAPDIQALDAAIDEIEEGMSKAAGQLLATHLAAERARQQEFPEQIDALRDALTEGGISKRVIIIIDELDRCHPEYAISLLEAMKLVFGRDGFVFCLMVNPHYLESIAHHRFGTKDVDELYLEKFVDLRLSLKATPVDQARAVYSLIDELELAIPFGASDAFSVEAAAILAKKIVEQCDLSFRQIKRIVDRLDLVLRCYRDQPIDLPLLVYLAFAEFTHRGGGRRRFDESMLKRAALTPSKATDLLKVESNTLDGRRVNERKMMGFVGDSCRELLGLPEDRYVLEPLTGNQKYEDWYKVLGGLAPHYIPSHTAMLQAVHRIMR